MVKLKGLRVLNTRPLKQGKLLTQAIRDAGGICIELPALTIEPLVQWLKNPPNLACIHQAIFISTNAVNYYFNQLESEKITWPANIQVNAIGNATASALQAWGIRVDQVPSISNSEHLLQLNTLQKIDHQTILLIKGEGGRALLASTLQARGAHVIPLDVYRRSLPKHSTKHIHSLWHDDSVDIILFTSQQAIHNIFTLFGKSARSWLCSKSCLVISERLAEVASTLGMQTIIISPYNYLLKSLYDYNQGFIHGNQQ